MISNDFIRQINDEISNSEKLLLIILIGLPLSGKDTLLSSLNCISCCVVSRDEILTGISKEAIYRHQYGSADSKQVDKLFFKRLDACAQNKINTIVNATNLTIKRRRKIALRFPHHKKIAIQMPIISKFEFSERNSKRRSAEGKHIPLTVYDEMMGFYEPLEENEGWNKIYVIK